MGSAKVSSQSPDPKFKEGLENLAKLPEGRERSMNFAELMLMQAPNTGAMGAVRRNDSEPSQNTRERQLTMDTSPDDFSLEGVRKRLLEKAKEERAKRTQQLAQEKKIYDESLPESTKEIKKSPLQFMVRGG